MTPPKPPNYADLQLQVSTGSDWTNVDLIGATLIDSYVSSTSNSPSVVILGDGFGLLNAHPSPVGGSNSAPPATAIVNLVYSLPDSGNVRLQLCRGYDGMASATLVRRTPNPSTIATVMDRSISTGGCTGGYGASTSLAVSQVTGTGTWPSRMNTSRHVMAVYYPWWDPTTFNNPPNTGALLPRWWNDTPLAPSDTTTESSVAAQVNQAAANGIDGFLLEYQGSADMAQRLRLVTQAAQAHRGFAVAPMVDLSYLPGLSDSFTPADQAAMVYNWTLQALSTTAGTAQLQQDGKPVVFYFATSTLTPSVWTVVANDLAAAGRHPFVVGDSTDPSYNMPGLFWYTPNTVPADANLPWFYFNMVQAARLQDAVHDNPAPGRLLAVPVSPGENNTEEILPPSQLVNIPRNGGLRYNDTWAAALLAQPDWVIVSTWNEWVEATGVAPSNNAGNRALTQTGVWSSLWRTPLPQAAHPARARSSATASPPTASTRWWSGRWSWAGPAGRSR
jgi:hypothetical protein